MCTREDIDIFGRLVDGQFLLEAVVCHDAFAIFVGVVVYPLYRCLNNQSSQAYLRVIVLSLNPPQKLVHDTRPVQIYDGR